MTRRGEAVALILTGVLIGLVLGVCLIVGQNLKADRLSCTEDMACWDCATMGNHICGPNEGR